MLIAGGGTGGHLFPGLAVADELRGRGAQVRFCGTARGIEARVVPQRGYPLALIEVAGLKGRGLRGALGVLRWPRTTLQTLRVLRETRPDVVVGVGGYASGPVVLLAALGRVPTALLEQNSVPGVTNRLLGRVVDLCFTAFPDAAGYFPAAKVRQLGNPIRGSLGALRGRARQSAGPPRVLVLGGSQGAHAVNELVTGAIEHLQAAGRPLPRIRHQTGAADEAGVRARYAALGLGVPQVEVAAFIDDMAAAYGESDLVIGRAGATTLAELCAVGLPAILIPFPHAADDHQTRNAQALLAAGAARLLPQQGATAARLAEVVDELCSDEALRRRMAEASLGLGRPQAAAQVATALLELAAGRGGLRGQRA